MNKAEILVVDDEYNTREVLSRYLKKNYSVTTAANGAEAIELLKKRDFDVVLTDLRMPEADGMSVLEAACGKASAPQCILLTAYGSIQDAVKAVKKGAFDFVPKPVKLNDLSATIKKALVAAGKIEGDEKDAGKAKKSFENSFYLPDDPNDPMTKVVGKARLVAPTKTTVLLTGESGTGKEIMARLIHNSSGRTGLFVPVHCAALTATLIASELFGYEKGAFTGAEEQRRGRFEHADGGTLFLDEIGEIDASTQVKLLRVLETRSFERVGGTETISCDVRLVAATNRNLQQMVKDGTFREDLFYRLSVVNLQLPPLRERKNEIMILAERFLKEFCEENNRKPMKFTEAARKKLMNYSWQGNIRELRNCIEAMTALATGEVLDVADLPENVRNGATENGSEKVAENGLNLGASERDLIKQALEKCGGNRSAAAKMLGISRRTIYRKLEEMDESDKNTGK